MKKVFSLLIIIMCLLLVGCSKSSMTIEQIVNVNFSEIDHIKTGNATNQDVEYSVENFTNNYKDLKYKKISGEYGNTSHKYFVCYDSDDKILFTLVETGNQNKVFIKKGNFDINQNSSNCLYQLIQ